MNAATTKPVRVIVFAKAPQPGYAKTRLIPALGANGAAELAQRMLIHTLNEALAADIGTVELCVTPPLTDTAWDDFPFPHGIAISDQCEGDLGARMGSAAQRGLAQQEKIILIGTDCAEMSASLLRDAAHTLNAFDSVIYCTADGGYALLGLSKFSPLLFDDIPWSTNAVAGTTLHRLGRLGWSVHVGQMLHDVDEAQDLKHLPEHWRSLVAA